MAMLRRDQKLKAVEAKTKARWSRIRFRDNREPATCQRPLMLGGPGDLRCWCSEPHGHDWPGKDQGAPHPPAP